MRQTIRQSIRRRAAAWARRRQGPDPDPVILDTRRIYILPTRLGLLYGAAVFTMLIGSMNYNNSMGLALTFLLASLGLVAMQQCHRNLAGLRLQSAGAEGVFAGQNAVFRVLAGNTQGEGRYQISLRLNAQLGRPSDLRSATQTGLDLEIPTERRGRLIIDRFSVTSSFPMNLFRAWAWVHMNATCLVYPRPAPPGIMPPPTQSEQSGNRDPVGGDDDFAGLRPYRPGDSPRHIAWKTAAREQELLVKEFAGVSRSSLWLDWESLPGLDAESRLSRLCRWILDAERRALPYGLRLPGHQVPPDLGRDHRLRCLGALALYEESGGQGR